MRSRRAAAAAVAGAVITLAAGCGGVGAAAAAPGSAPPSAGPAAAKRSGQAGLTARPHAGHATGQRPASRPLPRFAAAVSGPLARSDLPWSWHRGCPVPPGALRAIRLSYLGFDGSAHTGELIVNAAVARQVIRVFAELYRARFPISRMEPVDDFRGSDRRSMAADNTSGFNCRRAVAPGPPQWSMHAYGLAIDVNTVQNPYLEPGAGVQPPAGAAYLRRSEHRPGMAYPGGSLVAAFGSIGWRWGGSWAGSPDYQHFSANGR